MKNSIAIIIGAVIISATFSVVQAQIQRNEEFHFARQNFNDCEASTASGNLFFWVCKKTAYVLDSKKQTLRYYALDTMFTRQLGFVEIDAITEDDDN